MSDRIMFTGQYYDYEISQYYLRARQFDPILMRLTAKDPLAGENTEPLSLHKYLYCENEPINRSDPLGLWNGWIHRMFGDYGHGNGDLFDYESLDREHHPWNPLFTHEHFKSKVAAMKDIMKALNSGDPKAFEYSVHEFQDTYTHYDRGWTNNYHPPDPSIDDMDWSDPQDVIDFRYCRLNTRLFEQMFFKSNIDFWMDHINAELSDTNPWESIVDPSGSGSKAGKYIAPIYRAQYGEE